MNARRKSSALSSESLAGLLFVSPMLLGLCLLTLIPILIMLVLAFADWNIVMGLDLKSFAWVGLDNFAKLVEDSNFLQAVRNNVYFLLSVPVSLAISLGLAMVINSGVLLKNFFKVVFFLPYISSVVAVATVWQVLFHPSKGPVNGFLHAIGIQHPPAWIADPSTALLSLMMISIWITIGFSMIIYLAGLQNIPKDLYEAADIDGAGRWGKLRNITIPMLSPTTFFLLITGVIGTFKVFDLVAVLTKGGPAGSTSVLVWEIYDEAFVNLKVGYASSMSVILLIIVLVITVAQWVGQKKWVNY
jgi:multiple sugar transport system permease protein